MDQARMIADLEARARDLARRSREVRAGIRAAEAVVGSPDGVVTATVAPNGALRDIRFALPAEGVSDARLTEVVMETVRRAQAQVARRVAEVVEVEFGGTEAMEFLTGFLPEGAPEPVERVAFVTPVERVDAVSSVEPPPAPVEVPGLPLPRSLWCPEDGGEAAR
ncbi:YbaB/EbfC family nucleoid-associated protein [Saccharothrix sp. BKS2]|uniref:YbaB/EbfC family nucleoid-associated protein n=1 Tax=Saccharothrix sp. BKS2 TaxID=3064400 RepID=UPI0039ED8138